MAATTLHSVIRCFGRSLPFLESHGQALEQECCFPGVLSYVTVVMRLSISRISSMTMAFIIIIFYPQ